MPSPRTVTDSVATHHDASIPQNGAKDTMTLPQIMPRNGTGHPHAASLEQHGSRAQRVVDVRHAQEAQDSALELAQLGHEDGRRSLAYSQRVTLHVLEQVDHPAPWGDGICDPRDTTAGWHRLTVHGAAEFTLQQRLGQSAK